MVVCASRGALTQKEHLPPERREIGTVSGLLVVVGQPGPPISQHRAPLVGKSHPKARPCTLNGLAWGPSPVGEAGYLVL